MKRLHLIFGILTVIFFVLTGQYMQRYLGRLEGMEIGMRLLYRTRHIFILMSGLLNIGIGAYYVPRVGGWQRWFQRIGSTLLVAATGFFTAGFFIEPPIRDFHTPWSHWGAYSVLAGTLFHLFAAIPPKSDASGETAA